MSALSPGPDYLWLDLFLRRVTYKPGWTFTAEATPYGGALMVITAPVTDVCNPARTITLTARDAFPSGILYYRDAAEIEKAALHWLRMAIRQVEFHEADEWLVLDGSVRPFDPHRSPGG